MSFGKIQRIGFSWDMLNHGTTEVTHSLDFKNIILITDCPIWITIQADTVGGDVFGLGVNGGGYTLHEKHLELWRPSNGFFHGPNFMNPEVKRGLISIFYRLKT